MTSQQSRLMAFLTCIILAVWAHNIFAQGGWNATLNINPYPSPYLSDWENNPSIGQAEITNNTDQTVQVKISLSIERSGTGIIASGNSILFDFPPGSSQNIYSTDLVDYGTLDYNRDLEETALRTGRLPEGEYQACIRLEDADGAVLLNDVCAPFTIIYPDPPYLTFPFDGDSVTTLYPVFQWTPVQTPPGLAIHYSILVVEVISGQVPSQALAANIPQFEEDDISTTSLQYPVDALPLEDGVDYAWQVQALDDNGYPVTSNDGKSEIWTFVFATGAGAGGQPPPPPPPEGNIAIQITHISEAAGIFQDLYSAPFDSVLEILSSMADSGTLSIPVPIPDLASFPDISIPNGFLQLSDSLFTIGGQSNLDNRQTNIQYEGRRGSEGQPNSYSFDLGIPGDISFSDLINIAQPYFPSLGNLPINFDLNAPSLALSMYDGNVGLGIGGNFEIGQLSGSADISVLFADGGPSFDFSLGDLPDNISIPDLTAAAESLLTNWQPSTGAATEWIDSFNFDLNDLNLDLNFIPEKTAVDISGAFDTGSLAGRAGFKYIKEDEESSVSGYLDITLHDISLQDAIDLADSLFPGNWFPPSGPAVDWVQSLGLSFSQATLSLTFGGDQFGIGISGSFVTDQRSGTANLTFTQTGQQTSLSFNGAFDNSVSFTLNDALALFPEVQSVSFDMPWLESLTLNGPSLNLLLTPDSLIAGVSGAFTSGQRSGTAGLVYTQAGDNPVIKATVTFNQDASFALSDMVDLLPSSWPAPSGEAFDWLGNLGLNIPGITLEMILNSDCVDVSMFGPFELAGQQGSARVGFEYCGEGLIVSGGIQINTQEITFADALAMADSLLPGWSPPSGPVFDKIESLGFSFPSMTLDLSFTVDSLQVGLLGPFSFGGTGGGGNEQEGTSDLKLVRSNGQSSLLGGFDLNLSDIDLPAIMNTISNLLPDGWSLPSGPAIDRLQSLNLNFLQGASLGMNFNPSGLIDFDLFGPFHFGGGGGGQGDNKGESEVELVQDDNGYHLGGSLNFTLPQIELPGVMDLVSNLLPDNWSPSSLPSMDWLQSFDFSFDHPTLDIAFPQNGFDINFNGPFQSGLGGSQNGTTEFAINYSDEGVDLSGSIVIHVENINVSDAITFADSLLPDTWTPPSGPAVDWVQSLGLNFPEATLSLSFGNDHFGIGLSGSFVTDQRSGTADLAFTQVGQQTSLSFNGAFDNSVSFTLDDAFSLFPNVQPVPLNMPWLESLTLNGPSLNLLLTPDSLIAGVSGAFTSGQRSGTAGLVYTQAGDNPVIKATVTFNQDASFALSDMVDLLPSSWPAPSGEVFDWLGSLGLNIPGVTVEMILSSDCVDVSMFGPFALAGQQGSARIGFEYCGGNLVVSGGLRLETQEITFFDALAMADSLLPGWTPPSGPVFNKIESLGFSFPSMTLDLSFTMDSLQVGLLGPFSFGGGGGGNEEEGTSDIKLVRSNGESSLLGGFNLNLSDIDLPAIMNTISGLLPDGWTLPSGPAIDRLQSLDLSFLQGASLGMNFNPAGMIDFDLFGPFHFGGGGGGQGDNEGESKVELVQDDNGYHLGGSLNFTLPQIDLPGVMDLVSNLLPDNWSPSSLPSMDWLQSFDFSFDHPTLDIAFPQNGFDINFNGPFSSGQGNGSRSGNTHFKYQYAGEQNRFSGGLDFSLANIEFGGLISLADSLFGDRWSPPSGPGMDMIQSMDLNFPSASLSLGFNPDTFNVGIRGTFEIGSQQGSANLTLVRSGGETSVGGDISLQLHDIDYPGIMALADSLLPDSWNPPSGPAAQAIESLDLSFPEASLILSFSSENFDIGVSGSFVMGQRHGTVSMAFSTDNSGSSVTFSGSFGANEMFSLADLTSMFSPGQMSQQLDWLQSIQISGPTLGIFASADSVRGSVSGNFILNQKPGTADLSITTTSNLGMIAFNGAFNNGVTFSFSDILALLPSDMTSLNPPVDINLITPRISVVITNESFRAGISGNLNIAGQTGSASLAFSYDNGGPSLVFTGTVDHFSSDNMINFIQNQTGASNFADNLPDGLPEFNNLTITIGVGQDSRFSIAANSTFMGQQTSLLISVIKRSGHPPVPVIGIRPVHWSLSQAFPELSSPIVDELNLSTLGFIFSSSSDTLESSELSPEERQFYGGIRGSDDFTLKLNSGVMLMGTILPSSFNPDGAMAKILNLLGGGDQGLYLEGSLPLGFGHGGGGLDGLSLSLSLPPMTPPNPPDWFESGMLSVEITGSPIGVSLIGSVTTDIDDQVLTFFVAGAITIAGPNVSFTISGGLSTDEPWEQPFGIQWLVFNRAIILVGVNATGNISLGFRADMVIGEKDMDVAVLVSVNASGVPTNFMLDGESEAGFGMTDIAELQHRMAVVRALANSQPAPPMLPLELLPTMDIKNCRLKFAPRDEPALDITKGMAIAGELYIAFQSGSEPQDFAGIDMGVEDMRIHASGHLAAFALGPIVWDDGLFDMNLELGATHLIIDGQAQFLQNTQQVTVNMSRDSLFFHTATQIDNRFSTDLTGRGILNLQNPSMEVHGVMQSDFNGQFAQLLSDGISGFANTSDQAITAALNAYNQVSVFHEHKQQAIDSLTALLNNIRAAAIIGVNEARSLRDQAQTQKATALSQKNSAYSAWQNTPRRQVALRAQRYTTYVTKAGTYAAKASVYATRQAVFLAKQAAYNAIPSPDTDPVLVALRNQSDQLWAEMERRMSDLQNLQRFVQGIIDYMNQQGGPLVTIQGAQFDATLSALSQGGDVHLGVDLTLTGEIRHLDIDINLQDEASALTQMISSLVGTI